MCEWVFIVCTKEAAPAISFLSCCFPFNAFSACNFVYCRCCCCLFRMQFYGHISNAHLALHFPFRRPQHPLLPLLQLCNTRILFGKILHFTFCIAKLIWSAVQPAFALGSVLGDWSGHHFNYNGHFQPGSNLAWLLLHSHQQLHWPQVRWAWLG